MKKIEIIDGVRVRMLDDNFTKGERTFEKVQDFEIKGKVWHCYHVNFKGQEGSKYCELFKSVFDKKHHLDTNPEYDKIERYPSDECFGKWAYACVDFNHALEVVEKIRRGEK